MLGFIKNLFVSKSPEDATIPEQASAPKQSSSANAAAPRQPARPPAPRPDSNGNGVHLALQSILNGLPVELKSRVRQTEVGEATITIPIEKIISQLSTGIVKISYGEIRRAAAQVFSSAKDCDQVQVVLPLEEILVQIDPSMFVRRQDQRTIEVPDEISSPFGELGQGLVFSVGPGKTPASVGSRVVTPLPQPAQSRQIQPRQPQAAPVPPPAKQAKAPVQPVQPIKPPVQPVKPVAQPIQPIQPAQRPQPIQPAPIQQKPKAPLQPVPPAPIQPAPIQPAPARTPISTPMSPAHGVTGGPPAIPASPALRNLGASLSTTTISRRTPATPPPPTPKPAAPQPSVAQRPPAPQPPAPQAFTPKAFTSQPAQQEEQEEVFDAVPQPVPQPVKSEAVLATLPLSTLSENWSEPLRQEIAHMRLTDAKVALPAETTGEAVRKGKLAFPWKVVRSWIKPAVLTPSAHDNTVVELPLKVIAPLFLESQKGTKTQQKVAVDEEIPNLFFGFPQPEAPAEQAPASPTASAAPSNSAPASKTVDTNYYVWDDSSDSARVDEVEFKRTSNNKTPGTAFVTRYATPNEVVSRASALDGVSGALIALPDGLMVASKLSSDLNGDTLAAFLPHIFGKVSQCTKELRMGELNNLNFTVGNVPWKIFRVNAIFFAAFGRIGQPLPTAQLAALAAELDHKKQ